jgi:hypothetical protein
MAPRSKDARIRLLEPLVTDFAAFRAALGMGVTEIGVIRDAVRAFIDNRVAADNELKQRYEAAREQLRVSRQQPIRLVKSQGEPA